MTTTIPFDQFDWSSIDYGRDAVGADSCTRTVYVLRGFRVDTNHYEHIDITLPHVLFDAIWEAATDRASDRY